MPPALFLSPVRDLEAPRLVVRIQHLQWLGGVVAAAACLALGALSLQPNLNDHLRYRRAADQLERYHAALFAATAVSAERGPSNSAMGGRDADRPALAAALAASRARTDRQLAMTEGKIGSDQNSAALAALARQLRDELATGRATVDAVIARPGEARHGAPTRQAIEAMFEAADTATKLRDGLGRVAVMEASELASDIVINSLAGALREHTGRLGSYVVMKLTSDATVHPRLDAAIATTRARIDLIRGAITNYAAVFLPGTGLDAAIEAVENGYFRGALPYAERIAALRPDEPRPDADTFTRAYVPGMKPVEDLRDRIVMASRQTLDRLQHQSYLMVLASLLLTAVAVLAILAIALVFRDGLFRPLIAAHRQVLRIADGDLSEPPARGTSSVEVRDMFRGLETLRLQQRRRLELEDEQRRMADQLRHLSQTDMLTGLLNRRAINEAAAATLVEAEVFGRSVGVVLFDIDHFKSINDSHGHAVGDAVLMAIAREVGPVLDDTAAFARYGGEEFIVLLPRTTETEALALAERVRLAIAQIHFPQAPNLAVTSSFGIAVRPEDSAQTWENLVAIADQRLYHAKRAGRNRVCGPDATIAAPPLAPDAAEALPCRSASTRPSLTPQEDARSHGADAR